MLEENNHHQSHHNKQIFEIDGHSLSLEELHRIVSQKLKICLSREAKEKVEKARNLISEMMSDPERVVYGINTGFGNFGDKVISPKLRQQLQINLVRSHAVGVGQPIPHHIAKRMIILRINTLAKGKSGVDPVNLQKIIKAYNSELIPRIPEKGTVGASGDLAPLSHLALCMMGEGEAWDEDSQKYVHTSEVMQKKGLEPIKLKQKEGLALINGTQFMTSIISEVVHNSKILLDSAIIIFAFAVEIFGIDKEMFSESSIAVYENCNKGLGQILRRISGYLDEEPSELHRNRMEIERHNPMNRQAHSILYQPESFAGFLESLNFISKLVTQEMNSATDNPLVFCKEDGFEEDKLISAGNFHGQYVAKGSDYLGMILFNLGRFSESRIQRYINERTSNEIPPFLTAHGGLNSGFMIAQYTSAALLSESKVLVKPASVDSISTSASQEDHVSMGGFAARKAKILYDNMAFILGIELMCALQAVDLLQMRPSSKLQQIKAKVRQHIDFMETDRYFGPDITKAKNLVCQGLLNL